MAEKRLVPPATKLNFIALLAVISCFSVVLLHVNTCFFGDVREPYWISANIIESLFYFGAPCFFMITGATLIDYRDRYSTKEYFKRRVLKVVLPYIVWSFIAILILFGTGDLAGSDITFSFIINGLITGNIIGNYWFFPILFITYLVIPIIAIVSKKNRQRILQYIILVGFIVSSFIPFILNVSNLNDLIAWPYISSILVGPFIYVALGYIFKNKKINSKIEIAIYILGLASLLTHCIGTYFLSQNKGELVTTLKGYYTPLCYFYSSAVFLLTKRISNRCMKGWLKSAIDFISQFTFSIYLTHYFVMKYLIMRLYDVVFHLSYTSIVYRLTAIFWIVPIIILLTWAVRNIPIIKRILPK